MDIPYNSEQVIQLLADQIAALTRDNAILLSALQVAQSVQQSQYDSGENTPPA
jgi:hypothetical protein